MPVAELNDLFSEVSSLGWLVLKKFSSEYTPSQVIAALSAVSPAELARLRQIHFVLSPAVPQFLAEVDDFITKLPSRSVLAPSVLRREPRGKVDWAKTAVLHAATGGSSSGYITREVVKDVVTSGALLVAAALARVTHVAERLRDATVPDLVRLRCVDQVSQAQEALRVLASKGVRPRKRSPAELSGLRAIRRPAITTGLAVYDLAALLLDQASEQLLRTLLQGSLLAPGNPDDAFEIWLLLKIALSHMERGWSLDRASLIASDSDVRRPRFELSKGRSSIDLTYQTVPSELYKLSRYKQLFQTYGFSGSARRPDVSVTIKNGLETSRFFVEAKRTTDQAYIADSVYKCLGYLSDYSDGIASAGPGLILVVEDGVKQVDPLPSGLPMHIITASQVAKLDLFAISFPGC